MLSLAFALVAAAVGLVLVGRDNAEPYILILLAILGMIGVFSLFAAAAGILRIAGDEGNQVLKNAIDGATDGIVVTDSKGRTLYANAAYRALTNAVDADDIRPVERAFIGDPEVSEAVFRLLKAAREGRKLQEEVRIPALRNEPARWIRLRVRPLGTRGAAMRTAVWTVADVTRERERQENVFQELQQAIDYLDHAPAGFFSVDAAGGVSYLNATLAAWLGQDLAEIGSGGMKISEIVAGNGASLLTAIGGAPGEVKTETLDLDLKTRSGRTLPVRLYHKVAFAADGSRGASRTLVLNRATDGDAGRAAEVRFMRFFQNTPMAIATVDNAGNITSSNALYARMLQTIIPDGKRDMRAIFSLVAERDRPALEAVIARAVNGEGEIAPLDAALAGKGERWARFYVTPVEKDNDGQETAIVYVLDTTEQRNLEKQFAQSEKMKTVGQLAGGVAHDFNNVLSAIMMATDFLLNAHKPTDPSFQDIMQIKQNANRAASLVRHLLAFSRRQTLRPQVLDLGEALSDLSMLLRRVIGEKVTLEVVHGRDLWPVKTDLSQLEHVIVNLAVNARDAMPDGGKVTVRTSNVTAEDCGKKYDYKGMPAADYIQIEVQDTGTGIPADIIEQIFEPFFTTKDIGKGTGLGLSTVYGFIKQTGGFIYVDTELGKGSSFRIFLPRHVPAVSEAAPLKAEAAANAAPKPPADDTGQGIILLVEDEDGLRSLNARGLASRGYTVLEASNGLEAIELLEERDGKVDLVVSDVVMPEMDGPTLFKELRKRKPDLKVVFVSGYAEEAFAKSLPEGGTFGFLAKPFTLKQLVATVKETIAGEAKQHANAG